MEWLLTSVSNVTMANRRMHAPQHQGQHSIAKRAEAKRNSGSSSAAEAHQSTGEQIISRCAMLCVQSFVLNNVSSSLWRRAHSTAPLRTSAPSVHSPCAALCRCYPIRISLSQPQPIPAMPCHAMPSISLLLLALLVFSLFVRALWWLGRENVFYLFKRLSLDKRCNLRAYKM